MSAVGGAFDLVPVRREDNLASLLRVFAGLNSRCNALLLSGKRGIWVSQGSGGLLRTDGYTLIDATWRDTVDVPSKVGKNSCEVKKSTILSLQACMNGRQYDVDADQYLLQGYFRPDATLAHSFGAGSRSLRFRESRTQAPHFEISASSGDTCERAIEVGRPPNLTSGTPLVGRIGLRVKTGN